MSKKKRAVSLPMETIVIALILIGVLLISVLVVLVLSGKLSNLSGFIENIFRFKGK